MIWDIPLWPYRRRCFERSYGAFCGLDHNAQALRIVTMLERHYADFGLNLTWETLEGIAKHNGPVTGELPYALAEYNEQHDLEPISHQRRSSSVFC